MTVPAGDLRAAVATMMAAHWREGGYTVPHGSVYPWQWLWDSCFHSLIWAELGDGDRAVAELANALAVQDELGFVPHMTYHGDPAARADFWGRPGTSSITQPPVYGHAAAELVRRGVSVPHELVERAVDGVRFLLEHRARTTDGLVTVVHPWETGCDDSPRWDGWCPGGYERARFREVKGELLAGVEWSEGGAPLANPAFPVGSAGFNALVAWNALELAGVTGDDGLATAAADLTGALDGRWSGDRATWTDDGPHLSRGVRTADALLPTLLLTRDRDEAFAALGDGTGLGGPFGAAGTDRREPAYDPTSYWRGPVWPQVTYLLWVAASRAGHPVARELATGLRAGALSSGLAEYWHPDTAAAGGAVPQSWTGVALLV
ncbi:MAG: hypothetical protein ABWZ89_06215 [Acidimicrobiales bacterium]